MQRPGLQDFVDTLSRGVEMTPIEVLYSPHHLLTCSRLQGLSSLQRALRAPLRLAAASTQPKCAAPSHSPPPPPPLRAQVLHCQLGDDNYYFAFGGCHRWAATQRLQLPTIRARLIKVRAGARVSRGEDKGAAGRGRRGARGVLPQPPPFQKRPCCCRWSPA